MSLKVIYDFGSNNGDDIPYYLAKADRVVAVEANPVLTQGIKERFSGPIADERLFLEAAVLTVDQSSERVPFYLHKEHHFLSQLASPEGHQTAEAFERVELPSRNVLDVISDHGDPYYIKVDVEGYDDVLLQSLFRNDIVPPFISAEAHHIDVFCLMVGLGGYNAFKLVDGEAVSSLYRDHVIETQAGPKRYSFPHHSAGPFGNDILGRWADADGFFEVLSEAKLGWKDIHACKL